jgi:hypothetical protein
MTDPNDHEEGATGKNDPPPPQFLKAVAALPKMQPNTMRFFNRREYYSCHGESALVFARDYFK